MRRVLVVDDDRAVCESCTSILTDEGFGVQTAMSAVAALQLVDKESFDLLVVDLKMPGVDGIELMESIKAKAVDVPLVVITGYPSTESETKTAQLGALAYVPKPFTPDELTSGLTRALGTWGKARAPGSAGPPGPKLTAQTVEAAIKSVGGKTAPGASSGSAAEPDVKMIVVDLNACMACLTCVVECGAAHLADSDKTRAQKQLDAELFGKMLDGARVQVEAVGTHCMPVRCNQCEDPPCEKVCPTGAIRRSGPGAPVTIDGERCIGCKNCLVACPFGAIYISGHPSMLVKCDLCIDLVGVGEEPVCVRSCPVGALRYVAVDAATREKRRRAARGLYEASCESGL